MCVFCFSSFSLLAVACLSLCRRALSGFPPLCIGCGAAQALRCVCPALPHASCHPFFLHPASSSSTSLSVHVNFTIPVLHSSHPPLPDSLLLSPLSCPTSSWQVPSLTLLHAPPAGVCASSICCLSSGNALPVRGVSFLDAEKLNTHDRNCSLSSHAAHALLTRFVKGNGEWRSDEKCELKREHESVGGIKGAGQSAAPAAAEGAIRTCVSSAIAWSSERRCVRSHTSWSRGHRDMYRWESWVLLRVHESRQEARTQEVN